LRKDNISLGCIANFCTLLPSHSRCADASRQGRGAATVLWGRSKRALALN
jgi:hypothetical protein